MMDQPFTGKLLPLDPTTLADMKDAPAIQIAGLSASSSIAEIVPSRNGAVFAAVSYAANTLAHRVTIRIVDAQTSRELARVHPAISFFVSGVSDDCSQVYGPGNDNARLPFVTWYVLSGTSGRVVDVASGRIVAEAAEVNSIGPVSPDGSSVYSVGPISGNACPCVLRRRGPVTLQVTAERTFNAVPGLYLLWHSGWRTPGVLYPSAASAEHYRQRLVPMVF